MNNYIIIVIGTSHHNTLSIIKALGIYGIKSTVLIYGCNNSFVAKSRFVDSAIFFSTSNDVVNYLISKYCTTDNNIKPIVISCTDEIASNLDLHKEKLLPNIIFFHTSIQGRLTYYMNKCRQIELANKVGLNTPWSTTYTSNFNKDTIPYPCIIKPIASINGGKCIHICTTQHDIESTIARFGNNDILIQKYIQKNREIVIVGLTNNGKTTIPAYIEKYREVSGGTTFSRVREISELPSHLTIACTHMVTEIGYEGLWGIEFIQQDDKYYFIELNLRNDATTYSVAVAGINLPYIYVANKLGIEYNCEKSIKQIYSMVEHNDLMYALKHRHGFLKWFKDFNKAECKYILSMNDYCPAFVVLNQYIKSWVKKLFNPTTYVKCKK